jgi:hypothetical protein
MLGYLNSELVFYLVRVFELRQILNGTVACLPFPATKDLTLVGQLARSAHQLLLTQRAAEECSPFFVAPALLLALRHVDSLGTPVDHIHSSGFSWPTDEELQTQAPQAAALFARLYARHGTPDASLRDLGQLAWDRVVCTEQEVDSLQQRIDAAVYEMFEIGSEARRHISAEIDFRQCQPDLEEVEGEAVEPDASGALEAEQPAAQGRTTFLSDQVARLLSYAVKLVLEADDEGVVPILRAGPKPTRSSPNGPRPPRSSTSRSRTGWRRTTSPSTLTCTAAAPCSGS